MTDYKRSSLQILESLGPDFSSAGQFDIKTKKITDDSALLIRTMDDGRGLSVSYGIKFFEVDKVLSSSLSAWLKKRPDPFREPWACLFWATLEEARQNRENIPEFVKNITSSNIFSLQNSINIAWERKLVDGISKYEWPAACSVLRDEVLFEEISNYFKGKAVNEADYDNQLSVIWREGGKRRVLME